MLIDFHTHFFPDDIAEAALQKISSKAEGATYYGNGTIASLLDYMYQDGVDYSVNMPIATRPEQVVGINRRIVEYNRTYPNIISFGAMHPEFGGTDNLKAELEFLVAHGVKGIKLHPEYQKFYPDDPTMANIYESCQRLGLIVAFHAGRDIGFKEVHATPKRLAQVKKSYYDLTMILAHLGGWRMWDEVMNEIVGLHNVYIDTSFTSELDDWQMKEIIMGHGTYKVLFGSDFPWERASRIRDKIRSLGLGKLLEDMIFYRNARTLLGI